MSNVMRDFAPMPSELAQTDMSRIKESAESLHELIDSFGPSREFSLAKTKLEEAVMWAVKGRAIQDELAGS